MGLLDDAIREHLDLKRRRGADPSEVAREEAEALGPVRREAPHQPGVDDDYDDEPAGSYADHDPAGLDEPGAAYDDYDDEPGGYDDEPGGAVSLERAEELADRPQPAPEPGVHDAPYAEPEEESATPPHGDPLFHQQTREFSSTEVGEALGRDEPARRPDAGDAAPPTPPADVVPGDDEDAESEDELEETPEFLQETPEHDRLWFEQKPPKDFDF